MRITRRGFAESAAGALLALAGARIPAARAQAKDAPWFRILPEAMAGWQAALDPADPMRMRITRKGRAGGTTAMRVFVLFPRQSSAYDVAMSKILEVFDSKDLDVAFTLVNFETDDARGRQAVRLAEQDGHQLIFSMGSDTTAWLHRNYWGGILPVVTVCSKDPVQLGQMRNYEAGSGSNFAFTSLNMQMEAQLAYLLEVKPALRHLGILVDSRNVSAVQTQAEPMAALARQRGIRVEMLATGHPAHTQAELRRLLPAAIVEFRKSDAALEQSVFLITGSTQVFKEIETINAHADRVPVLSMVPEVVTEGDASAVLSVGISFESNAHLAAVYGIDVLRGQVRAGELKVGIVSPPDIAINFRQARRIGLKIPFRFFESAGFVYDYEGRPVRLNSRSVALAGR